MNKATLFFLGILFTSIGVDAQMSEDNCEEAQHFFEHFKGVCQSKISAHNCIHLDVTDSYDFEGKEFVFKWQMGDGTELEGMEVNHCYQKPGRYKAILTLLDPVSKATIKDEAAVNVMIKGEFKLDLKKLREAEVNRAVSLDYDLTFPENAYKVDQVYWYFGDGHFSCDAKPDHIYEFPGSFTTRLIMKLSSAVDEELLCTRDTLEVKVPDPTKDLLRSIFDSLEIASRFLADEVHYKVLTKQNDRYSEVYDTDTLTGEGTYQLLAYRGAMLFGSAEVITSDTASNNGIRTMINAEAKALAKTLPVQFNAVFFELDQDDLSKKNKREIKENMALLEKYPMLSLAIGVYTNSRGSLAKGIELSIHRATLIKNYMVANGIDARRLQVEDPDKNRSLINTCLTLNDCDYSNPELDRKAEFKILSQLN